ncbi:MAG: hypothetical protein RL338_1431 [Chloroflexota bacterium]
MSDRPYHHGDLAEALVAAGLAAAAVGGPASIGVRELAKEVGVSPTAVYRHFPSLAHLVAAVSQRARERLAERLEHEVELIAVDDPVEAAWERLFATGRAYVRFAIDEPNLHATAFVAGGMRPAHPDSPDAWSVLVRVLNDLERLGEVAPDMRASAPLIAWSAVHGVAGVLTLPSPADPVDPQEAVESVMRAVRRALGGREGPPRSEREGPSARSATPSVGADERSSE